MNVEITLYHGSAGGDYHPNPIHLEALISRRMGARGLVAQRHGTQTTYVTPDRTQAQQYADCEMQLHRVLPHTGSLLTWLPGVHDFILAFEEFLRSRWIHEDYVFDGISSRGLLNDTRGDVGTLDVYLAMGRQSSAVSRMIDAFLDRHPAREIRYTSKADLMLLQAHGGEIILTGGRELVPVYPAEACDNDM